MLCYGLSSFSDVVTVYCILCNEWLRLLWRQRGERGKKKISLQQSLHCYRSMSKRCCQRAISLTADGGDRETPPTAGGGNTMAGCHRLALDLSCPAEQSLWSTATKQQQKKNIVRNGGILSIISYFQMSIFHSKKRNDCIMIVFISFRKLLASFHNTAVIGH